MENEELDINKIAANIAVESSKNIIESAIGIINKTKNKIYLTGVTVEKTYSAYLKNVAEKYIRSKSFFIRAKPTYLYEFYVPLDISCGKIQIKNASVEQINSITRYALIAGVAGIGKSMLLRHLFIDALKEKKKVPVMVELRQMNQEKISLRDLIKRTLKKHAFELDDNFIELAMKKGHFAFFFDGYDETILERRNDIRSELGTLTVNYEHNAFFVTSRPDSELYSWPDFSLFQIDPLTIDKACLLVTKLPFDEEIKEKFKNDLRDGMFNKHRSFLANPLLLSIMLLTYGSSADIPNKMSVFYAQAYEALFQRHDALKSGFQRERQCGLDIDDFARVFSMFCLLTYDNKRQLDFFRSEAIDYLKSSKKFVNLEFKPNNYLDDALQAVSLLVEDGLKLTFSHRSFQEYFVARFIKESNNQDVQRQLINRYAKNAPDNTINLLHEMDRDLVERLYILPKLNEFMTKIQSDVGLELIHYLRLIQLIFSKIDLNSSQHPIAATVVNNDFAPFVIFVLKHYWSPDSLMERQDTVRMLKKISDKYIAEASSKFFRYEFESSARIKDVLSKIQTYYASEETLGNSIEDLNKLLNMPALFLKLEKKIRPIKPDENLKKIIKRLKRHSGAVFSEIETGEQNIIRQTNRQLLNKLFPDLIPGWDRIVIYTEMLTINDSIVSDLAGVRGEDISTYADSGIFTMATLKELRDIRERIIKKHTDADISLNKLLANI